MPMTRSITLGSLVLTWALVTGLSAAAVPLNIKAEVAGGLQVEPRSVTLVAEPTPGPPKAEDGVVQRIELAAPGGVRRSAKRGLQGIENRALRVPGVAPRAGAWIGNQIACPRVKR